MLGDGRNNISMDFSQINALLLTPLVAIALAANQVALHAYAQLAGFL